MGGKGKIKKKIFSPIQGEGEGKMVSKEGGQNSYLLFQGRGITRGGKMVICY